MLNAERDTSESTGNGHGSGDLPLSIRGFGGSSLGRNYFQWGLESDTKTFGLVLHFTPWMSGFYNRSDNFVPQSTLTILDPCDEGSDLRSNLSSLMV